ncbi:hypothetical protein, variant [Allomyces macrogynus ATCC 38327]|nr:hypothetical protein, variant [Allomyces macrogynus ATCC 38327]|eukprot:KNE60289.1 hypothetical protein, variant [Allomyces macrogynus ATCC 38327]
MPTHLHLAFVAPSCFVPCLLVAIRSAEMVAHRSVTFVDSDRIDFGRFSPRPGDLVDASNYDDAGHARLQTHDGKWYLVLPPRGHDRTFLPYSSLSTEEDRVKSGRLPVFKNTTHRLSPRMSLIPVPSTQLRRCSLGRHRFTIPPFCQSLNVISTTLPSSTESFPGSIIDLALIEPLLPDVDKASSIFTRLPCSLQRLQLTSDFSGNRAIVWGTLFSLLPPTLKQFRIRNVSLKIDEPARSELALLLHRLPALRVFILNCCLSGGFDVILAALPRTGLQQLVLGIYRDLTGTEAAHIATLLPAAVDRLELRITAKSSADSHAFGAHFLTAARDLDISFQGAASSACRDLPLSSALQRLRVAGDNGDVNALISLLGRLPPALTHLELVYWPLGGTAAMAVLASRPLPQLVSLRIVACNLKAADLVVMEGQWPPVKVLDLSGNDFEVVPERMPQGLTKFVCHI